MYLKWPRHDLEITTQSSLAVYLLYTDISHHISLDVLLSTQPGGDLLSGVLGLASSVVDGHDESDLIASWHARGVPEVCEVVEEWTKARVPLVPAGQTVEARVGPLTILRDLSSVRSCQYVM